MVLSLHDEGQWVIVTSLVCQSISGLCSISVAEDDSHLTDTSDMEGGSFQVALVLDDEVHDVSNVTGFVEGSIYVIDGNGLGEAMGV